ncbi:MAG TPA: hypothetical protein VFU07_05460 [Candidatus Lumbricidophila sp.]|nr:hypothetical protein [Candidatus Lumbricidophila sp.]
MSTDDQDWATTGACGDVAHRAAELLPGWTVVVLSTNDTGYPWIHAALRSPDDIVVDAKGASKHGSHIIANDTYYFLFDQVELMESDGEVELVELPSDAVRTPVGNSRDEHRIERVAQELAAFARTVTPSVALF